MAGTIMMKELGTVIKSLGQHLIEAELRNMVEEVDANGSGANADGSGAIDFNMFLSLVARQMWGGADAKEELREAFQVFDKDINGFIPLDELCHVMKKLGEKFSEDELNKAGVNADGQINYKEFAKVMLAN